MGRFGTNVCIFFACLAVPHLFYFYVRWILNWIFYLLDIFLFHIVANNDYFLGDMSCLTCGYIFYSAYIVYYNLVKPPFIFIIFEEILFFTCKTFPFMFTCSQCELLVKPTCKAIIFYFCIKPIADSYKRGDFFYQSKF